MFSKKDEISKTNEKRIFEWVNGDYDPVSGSIIDEIVLKTDTFIVYIDVKCDIMWSTIGHKTFGVEFGDVCNRYRKLEYLVDRVFIGKGTKKKLKSLIAEGLARSLDGHEEKDSMAALKFAEDLILKQVTNTLKARYLYYAVGSTCATVMLLGLSWYFRNEVILKIGDSAFVILIASFAGGIGAFFSTFTRSLKFKGDPWIQPAIYQLDGFLRIFYGLVAGFAITLALKANIVLSFANISDERTLPLLCFFAMIGGASETLIPSLIKKIEDQNSSTE